MSAFQLKLIPWLSWVIIVLGGLVILIWMRSEPRAAPAPRAATDLPRNTLLRGDLAQPGFTGRYVIAEYGIKAGSPIKPEYLGDAPVPAQAPPAKLLLVVPVEGTSSSIDMPVGSSHQLCDASSESLATVQIEYVSCSESTRSCAATVKLPFTALASLAASNLAEAADANALRLAPSCRT